MRTSHEDEDADDIEAPEDFCPPADKIISVTISGKAWRAESLGNDPYYTPDDPGIAAVQKTAVVRRHGRGERVELSGTPHDLLHLAKWFQLDGETWLGQCDTKENRDEARACLKAAEIIRKRCAAMCHPDECPYLGVRRGDMEATRPATTCEVCGLRSDHQ